MEYKCPECGKSTQTKHGLLCHIGANHPELNMKRCEFCQTNFKVCASNRGQKTCSYSCRTKLAWKLGIYKKRRKKKVKCDHCGKYIFRPYYRRIKNKNFFCSYKCKGLWQKKNLRGDKNPNYGNDYSEETRQKIGNREYATGENHHLWNGGLSFEPYSSEFTKELKEKIRLRDKYQCQICDKSQDEEFQKIRSRLSVHHINGDKKDSRDENLATLCRSCHSKVTTGVIQLENKTFSP